MILREQKITALIVDDEKSARETLNNIIRLYCQEVTILGEANSSNSALPMIWRLSPDIIFLDVEMPGCDGFDLLKKSGDINSKIIFTTGYDQYALKAIKASALDYLLKPIDISELKDAISKFKKNETQNDSMLFNLFKRQIENKKEGGIERLAIPSSEKYDIVKTNEILYCEGNRNYTSIYLVDKKVFVACKTLKEYERLLISSKFVRVHQKYLVNLDFVKKYIRGRGGTLVMKDGKHITVSQNKRSEVNKAILSM